MKGITILFSTIILFSLLFIKCDKSENNSGQNSQFNDIPAISEIYHSMKGYELYSWEDNSVWNYTLITGTNRTKTFEEISSNENIVEGGWVKISTNDNDKLKQLIEKLPEDELVFWMGNDWIQLAWGNNYGNVELPSENTQNELLIFCNTNNVRLSIVD